MNYLKYFFLFIFLISICINLQLETRILLSILLSFGGVYILYLKDKQNVLEDSKKTKKISDSKKNISNNTKVLEEVKKIYFLKKINKKVYKEFLSHLNNFYTIIDDFNTKNINLKQNFTILLDERKKMLNSISSSIYNCPQEYEDELETTINNLENLTYSEIITIENRLNNLWQDDIDNNKQEFDLDAPEPNDIKFNQNYDLY